RDLALDVVPARAACCSLWSAAPAAGRERVDHAPAAEQLREQVVERRSARLAEVREVEAAVGAEAAARRSWSWSPPPGSGAGRLLVGPRARRVEALRQAHLAELVVVLAPLRVAEHLVGARELLELLL